MKLESCRQFFLKKLAQISNFMKIRPVEAEMFHADGRIDGRTNGQTDLTKLWEILLMCLNIFLCLQSVFVYYDSHKQQLPFTRNSINWLVFVAKENCVLCEVKPIVLLVMYVSLRLEAT